MLRRQNARDDPDVAGDGKPAMDASELAVSRTVQLRADEMDNTRQRNELAQSRLEASVAQVVVRSSLPPLHPFCGKGLVARFQCTCLHVCTVVVALPCLSSLPPPSQTYNTFCVYFSGHLMCAFLVCPPAHSPLLFLTLPSRPVLLLLLQGTAVGIVGEFEEIIVMLSERMRTAEDTARAVNSAAATIDAEAMLARAKAEADAWTNGTPAARRLAAEMPPMQVQAVVAERNELRAQIRAASSQLRAIEVAAGGNPLELVKICQADMERMAKLRSQVELEQQQQLIQLHGSQDELENVNRQLKVAEIRTVTSEEQLAERAQAVVRLSRKHEALQGELEQARQESEEQLEEQLRLQHERLFSEAEADKDEVCKRLVHELQEDKRAALESTRQQMDAESENRLQTMLSEQRHTLLAQASRERSESLDALQRELESREARNMEALKDNLSTEHARVIKSMEARIRTIESRAALDLQEASRQTELDHERALEQQKRELSAQANREQSAAMEKLEANMTAKHQNKLDDLQRQLLRKHADELAASSKRMEDANKKKFGAAHAKELRTALAEQDRKGKLANKEETQALVKSMKQRFAGELEASVSKEAAALTKKLEAGYSRDKAQALEQAKTDARVDKTRAMESLRQRMNVQHSGDVEMLKKSLSDTAEKLAALRQDRASQVEQLMTEAKKEKAVALSNLRDRLVEQSSKDATELRAKNAKLAEEVGGMKQQLAANSRDFQNTMRADKTSSAHAVEARIRAKAEGDVADLREQLAQVSADLKALRQEKAALGEKLQAENRVEKTRELEALRGRLEDHYSVVVGDLKGQVSRLSSERRDLNQTAHTEASKGHARTGHGKQSLKGLRDALRKLLNEMKLVLVPSVDAPLDLSEASPSQSMGALQVLIKGLSLKVPDVSALADPSREAQAAPMVSFDILRACVGELCAQLGATNDEIFRLRREEMREHKLMRKQIEEEMEDHYRREMLENRDDVARQVDMAASRRGDQLHSRHMRTLEQHQDQMQKELRTAKHELHAKKKKIEEAARASTAAQYEDQLSALVHEAETLKQLLQERDRRLATLRQENHSLRDEVSQLGTEMNATQFLTSPSPSSRGSSRAGARSGSGAGSAASAGSEMDLNRLYQERMTERSISEMERLKLEKQLTNMQASCWALEEELEDVTTGTGSGTGTGGEY